MRTIDAACGRAAGARAPGSPRPCRPGPALGLGFSLAELVVALSILLILLPAAFPIYDAYVKDSQEAALRGRLLEMRRAIRTFFQDHGRFPYMNFDAYGNAVDFMNSDLSELTQGTHDGRGGHYPVIRRRYIDQIPTDPFTGQVAWALIQPGSAPRSPVSREPLQTTTGSRMLRSLRRAVTSGTVQILDNISEVQGLLQVMDVRSKQPGYGDF